MGLSFVPGIVHGARSAHSHNQRSNRDCSGTMGRMNKHRTRPSRESDFVRQEYDFSKGTRGKHAGNYASGTNVVVLDPDVANVFPTAKQVNETLRAVSEIIKKQTSARE